MRVVLVTGKGGVGKTTVAAATATLAAARGLKTLVVSTDPAHSLADAFAVPVGAEPTPVDDDLPGLAAMQVDAQARFERTWRSIREYLVGLLERAGIDPVEAEELTVLPGAEEVLALLAVRDEVASGRWDAVVVDCAASGEALRLLALPEALRWYVEKILPAQRRLARGVRPVLSSSRALPTDEVFAAVLRLHADLLEVQQLLTDAATTSVRLVLTPEQVVLAEARRTATALAMLGHRVDGVVANRVFPDDGGAFLSGWAAAQRERLEEVRASFAPLPVSEVPYAPSEPVGVAALHELGTVLHGDADPVAALTTAEPMRVERTPDGYVLVLALPFASPGSVDLARAGDELVVTLDGRRRLLTLPSALRRCVVTGARMRDGALRVSFEPDPALWMQR